MASNPVGRETGADRSDRQRRNVITNLLDGWVRSPRRRRVHVMSPLPMTAVSQMRPKVDDSATVAHWKRLSTEDSTTSASVDDVVSPPITSNCPPAPSPPTPVQWCWSWGSWWASVPAVELNAIISRVIDCTTPTLLSRHDDTLARNFFYTFLRTWSCAVNAKSRPIPPNSRSNFFSRIQIKTTETGVGDIWFVEYLYPKRNFLFSSWTVVKDNTRTQKK